MPSQRLRARHAGAAAAAAAAAAIGLAALGHVAPAAAHVTFKLPVIPGITPGSGYVPYDGPYLSNSPFMLNAPHSEAGYNTIALQCQVPTGGWSITPQEVAGWDLTLSNNTAGALTAFTYTLNADAAFPNGFARAAQDTPINGLKSDFAAFIGISSPSGTCNFTDPVKTVGIGGYPHLYVQCAEVTVASNLVLNAAGYAAVIAASFNASTTPLHTLLWWATPANVVSVCNQWYPNSVAGQIFQLDPQSSTSPATSCTSWPCSVAAPFGRAYANVDELASAPHIGFIPNNCWTAPGGPSAGCIAPFYGATFQGCPTGVVTVQTSVPTTANWTSSPCGAAQANYQAAANSVAYLGGLPALSPPPAPPSPPPTSMSMVSSAAAAHTSSALAVMVAAAVAMVALRQE